MICKNCGAEVAEGSVFCTSCGNKLDVVEETPVAEPVVEEPAVKEAVFEETVVAEPIAQPAPEQTYVVADAPVENKKYSKAFGIVSLVTGIIAVLTSGCNCLCGCLGGTPSIICAILAIVFGAIASKKAKEANVKDTMARVGLILGIVGVAVFFIIMILNFIIGFSSGVSDIFSEFDF